MYLASMKGSLTATTSMSSLQLYLLQFVVPASQFAQILQREQKSVIRPDFLSNI
jgi:hypothetical protein